MKSESMQLKSIIAKMKIEKLVFGGLKVEELTDEFVNKFVDIMEKSYDTNIMILEDILKNMENEKGEKDGK